jgi:hypothetical protein
MNQINTDEIVLMYMTLDIRHDRIEEFPPKLPFEVDDESLQAAREDNAKKAAYQYDRYKDIVQLSFYHADQFHHFVPCENWDGETEIQTEHRSIKICSTEAELVQASVDLLGTFHVELGAQPGMPTAALSKIFAGWKIHTELWPILVNKALQHGVQFPVGLKNDPLRRFSTLNNLLEVSGIYAQGINMSMRKLPALADVLEYWGYTDYPHPRPAEIKEKLCEDPAEAAKGTESYLVDMYDVIRRYYLGETNE